jgi:hypothetical protein
VIGILFFRKKHFILCRCEILSKILTIKHHHLVELANYLEGQSSAHPVSLCHPSLSVSRACFVTAGAISLKLGVIIPLGKYPDFFNFHDLTYFAVQSINVYQ